MSPIDPHDALVEALREAIGMIESEYCSHTDGHGAENPRCYAQHQYAALALAQKEKP